MKDILISMVAVYMWVAGVGLCINPTKVISLHRAAARWLRTQLVGS